MELNTIMKANGKKEETNMKHYELQVVLKTRNHVLERLDYTDEINYLTKVLGYTVAKAKKEEREHCIELYDLNKKPKQLVPINGHLHRVKDIKLVWNITESKEN